MEQYKRYYDSYQTNNMNNKFNAIFLQKDVSTHWIDKSSVENEMMMEFYDVVWGNITRKDITYNQIKIL